jgi:hypothetical protein
MDRHDHIETYRARGFAVVRRVFDGAEVAALAAAFDRVWSDALAKGRS